MDLQYWLVEDAEGDDNRGWTVHQIFAMGGDELAGYIKTAYIPQKRFAQRYPNIVPYLCHMKGKVLLPVGVETIEECNDEQLRKSCSHIAYETLPWGIASENVRMMSNYGKQSLMTFWNEGVKTLEERYGKEFEAFRDFHVDKPIVDYVRVMDGYRRRGIATALYLEMAHYLAEQGLVLRASGLQAKEAAAWWDKAEKAGLVATAKDKRKHLCVS